MDQNSEITDTSELSTEALIAQLDSANSLRIVGPTSARSNGSANSNNIVAKRLLSKNAKKSRKPVGKNKGEPKKAGAGSKTVWGKPGCELYATSAALDDGDPNYDSETQDDSFMDDPEPRVLPEEDFRREVKNILQEYFQSGDVNEVAEELRELENTRDYGNYIHQIVSMALMMAFEHKPAHRELVSALLADTCKAEILDPELIATGFTTIIRDLNDLVVDIPDVVEILGRFMARAVADNCLTESFINNLLDKENSALAGDAAKVAIGLLADRRMVFRLDGIWISTSVRCGESVSYSYSCSDSNDRVGDNSNDSHPNGISPRSRNRFDSGSGASYYPRPVMLLTQELQALLKEYLAAGDCDEFIRQLRGIDVPHFHHELIYELLLMMVNENRDAALEAFLKLTGKLVSEGVVTQRQIAQAYRRIDADCDEILIDMPLCEAWIAKFAQACIQHNIHNSAIFDSLPIRGRKRFCSEGDGGQLKN